MLILTRHTDESIIIGDDVIVTIVSIRGDKVRLGITCPAEVAVDRTEVRAERDRRGCTCVGKCTCQRSRP
jgi:carbon storage regulator